MQLEFILSDYFASVGAVVFLCVALSELGETRHLGLPKSALASLFLLVIAACLGSLVTSSTSGPLQDIRELLNMTNIISIPGLSLLLLFAEIAYLATTLTPQEGNFFTRVFCAIGVIVAVALCVYLLFHTIHLGAMSERGTALYAFAFLANAFGTGYILFVFFCQFDPGITSMSAFDQRITLAVCVLQITAYLSFTASFIVQLAGGISVSPSLPYAIAIIVSWLCLILFGIARLTKHTYALVKHTDLFSVKFQRHLLRRVLLCSILAGIALQCIIQLSDNWIM